MPPPISLVEMPPPISPVEVVSGDEPRGSAPEPAPLEAPSEDSDEEPPRDPLRAEPACESERAPLRGVESDEEPGSGEPVEPAEPVVSAKADGIHATAAPTPRATANPPTRPT